MYDMIVSKANERGKDVVTSTSIHSQGVVYGERTGLYSNVIIISRAR